ncbi:MAG TPA: HD domain-containing protein [Holophaga sp.]|jgi:tRNA nucleotidyltransferase/poly(A) polymerase|nr:HD domain-containing protein [Holophaga sp.]
MLELPLDALGELQSVLGDELFAVGGAVRDLLLGRPIGDVDLATPLLPQEVMDRAKGRLRAIPTGLKHGTITLLARDQSFEITTFRSDGDYLDGRRPESVKLGVALEKDLARRDFTINAMALPVSALHSPEWKQQLVDPFGGQRDLERGTLRAVGDPLKRFAEDGLRPYRACRFAAQLDFELEPETLAAVPLRLDVSRKVAVERVFVELNKLLCSLHPAKGLRLLEQSGLLDLALPELRAMVACQQNHHHRFDVWEHTLAAFEAEATGASDLRWAILLHDVGKPGAMTTDEEGVRHFYGHEGHSTEMADAILRRLKTSNPFRARVTALIALHGIHPEPEWTDAAFRRLLKRLNDADIAPETWERLQRADQFGKGWATLDRLPDGRTGSEWWASRLQAGAWAVQRLEALRAPGLSVKELALDGHALMRIAQRSGGPWLSELQNHLLDQVLEDPATNAPDRLQELAAAWIARRG